MSNTGRMTDEEWDRWITGEHEKALEAGRREVRGVKEMMDALVIEGAVNRPLTSAAESTSDAAFLRALGIEP